MLTTVGASISIELAISSPLRLGTGRGNQVVGFDRELMNDSQTAIDLRKFGLEGYILSSHHFVYMVLYHVW